MSKVYLGCDTGEASDYTARVIEDALMDVVDAVSIACGGHAGDSDSMRRVLNLARERNLLVGAHPSYPDREHFGRRPIDIDRVALGHSITNQLDSLRDIAETLGVQVSYVKAHGALYHALAQAPDMSVWFWEHCEQVLPNVRVVLPIGCPSLRVFQSRGIPVLPEGFCDRRYRSDGTLVPRECHDAMINDPAQAATQAAQLMKEVGCELLCVHSDSDHALLIAKAVCEMLDSR